MQYLCIVILLFVLLIPQASAQSTDESIHVSAKEGKVEKVNRLLKANPALLDSKQADWSTSLNVAAHYGRLSVAGAITESCVRR